MEAKIKLEMHPRNCVDFNSVTVTTTNGYVVNEYGFGWLNEYSWKNILKDFGIEVEIVQIKNEYEDEK